MYIRKSSFVEFHCLLLCFTCIHFILYQDVARLHPDTAEATSKMLSAILVQIQEFGDVGLEFLNSWGVTPLTEKFIEEFKADDSNWPYLQAGYYVGLTSVVEYMDIQTDGIENTVGAWETVRQVALSLGLSPAQVRNLGAISDSLFICVSSFYLFSTFLCV